jgi:hypothetical protein
MVKRLLKDHIDVVRIVNIKIAIVKLATDNFTIVLPKFSGGAPLAGKDCSHGSDRLFRLKRFCDEKPQRAECRAMLRLISLSSCHTAKMCFFITE